MVDQAEIRRAAVLQYAFYGTAALFALVGQVWAGVEKLPFPHSWPWWAAALVITPAFAVIELAGVTTSHQADLRRRLGEQACGYRALSLLAAVVAAGFKLAGPGERQQQWRLPIWEPSRSHSVSSGRRCYLAGTCLRMGSVSVARNALASRLRT